MFTPFNDNDLDSLAVKKIAVVHPLGQELPIYARGYAANNVYPGFPPLMNDGRALIASWQPEAIENQNLLKTSGVKTNWDYRKYLTHNAKSIIEMNFAEAANDSGYSFSHETPSGRFSGESSNSYAHASLRNFPNAGFESEGNSNLSPIISGVSKKHATPAHYGSYIDPESDYGKFDSNLKASYLSREQLAARMVTPVINQSDLLEWKKSQ